MWINKYDSPNKRHRERGRRKGKKKISLFLLLKCASTQSVWNATCTQNLKVMDLNEKKGGSRKQGFDRVSAFKAMAVINVPCKKLPEPNCSKFGVINVQFCRVLREACPVTLKRALELHRFAHAAVICFKFRYFDTRDDMPKFVLHDTTVEA